MIISEEILRMQKLAGLITENQITENEQDFATPNDVDLFLDKVKQKIKQLSYSNSSAGNEIAKMLKDLVDNFVNSDKNNNWNFFKGKQGEELKNYKKEYIVNEVEQRIGNFLFNAGSNSYVRAYSNGYEVVSVLHKALVNNVKDLFPEFISRLARYMQGQQKKTQ